MERTRRVRISSLVNTPGRTRVAAAGALAFAVILLAACSSSTSSAPSSGGTTGAATTESTPDTVTDEPVGTDSESAPDDSGSADSDVDPFTANPNNIALTAAGTTLALGEPATVPVSSGPDQGVITLGTFTLAQGSDADWTALEGEGYDPAGTTPWYLKLTITVESGSDIAFDSVETNLEGVVTGQDPLYGDIALQDNTICPIATVADNFTAGQSYDSCIVFAVPSGQSVSQISFAGDESPYTTEYIDKPVVWTAG